MIPSPGAASEAAEAAPTVAHADATPPASPVTSTAPAPAAPAPQAVPMKDEGPSFDCSKVIVPTAITICSNPELSALDRQMATLYYATDYAINPNTRAQQRQWIKQRNDTCGVSVDCLRTQFNDRIRQLQEAVPAPASGPLAAAISQDRIASIRAMSEAQFEEQFRCPESYATDAELGPWLADLRAWLQTHDAQSTQASREAFLRKLLTMHNCHPRTSQHR
ncbi:MAG TPA: lysozyme inhibitor LprI family protein [Xanthomonadaceae bacterium]|nr:lysozyme inhibitor LprI family protein [Xanthomonadaceae bacterium]